MIKTTLNLYNNLSMRHKLYFQYLIIISISLIVFIFIYNRFTSQETKKQAEYLSRQMFEQSRSYLEYKIENVNMFLSIVSLNGNIQDILKKEPELYDSDYGTWAFDIDTIRKQLFISRPSEDLASIQFYIKGSLTELSESEDVFKFNRIVDSTWYKEMDVNGINLKWFAESGTSISVAKTVRNNSNLNHVLGIIKADLPIEVVTGILDRATYFKSSSVYLVNEKSEILGHSSYIQTNTSDFIASLLKNNESSKLESGVWENQTFQGNHFLVGIQQVNGIDGYLVEFIPYNQILSSQKKAMEKLLIIALFSIPFTLPLAYIGAFSGSNRIRKLISQMKNVKKGEFNVRLDPGGKDEIGELTHNFNTMINKISILLNEKYEMGKEIKSFELTVLQAQINPHFLYNTLDLVYWKARDINEPSIYEVIQSLSKFYKLSLRNGMSVVTLWSEIEHIKAFVDIQNARFHNAIKLIIDIPKSLQEFKVPKILLQPLIENSIIHGILEKEEESGVIEIIAFIDNEAVIIEVRDDGVGISNDLIGTLLEREPSESSNGYGVININRRIKLLYGDEYDIKYESILGFGTTVTIRLPLYPQVAQ